MSNKYSTVLVREWSDHHSIGIYDNCKWSIRLYEDRAIYKDYTVRWHGNSGSLAEVHERWTGKVVETLKEIVEQEIADEFDYTDHVYMEIVRGL